MPVLVASAWSVKSCSKRHRLSGCFSLGFFAMGKTLTLKNNMLQAEKYSLTAKCGYGRVGRKEIT